MKFSRVDDGLKRGEEEEAEVPSIFPCLFCDISTETKTETNTIIQCYKTIEYSGH